MQLLRGKYSNQMINKTHKTNWTKKSSPSGSAGSEVRIEACQGPQLTEKTPVVSGFLFQCDGLSECFQGSHDTFSLPKSCGAFNPFWRICSSNWVHLPQFLGWIFKRKWVATTWNSWWFMLVLKISRHRPPAFEATNFSDRRMRPSFFWCHFCTEKPWEWMGFCPYCVHLASTYPFLGGEQLSPRCSDSLIHKPHMAG